MDKKLWSNVNRHGGIKTASESNGTVTIITKDGNKFSADTETFKATFPKVSLSESSDPKDRPFPPFMKKEEQ